jgi:hypothetical protein
MEKGKGWEEGWGGEERKGREKGKEGRGLRKGIKEGRRPWGGARTAGAGGPVAMFCRGPLICNYATDVSALKPLKKVHLLRSCNQQSFAGRCQAHNA